MNYYEEFGLGQGASTEEVRQAYRTLARVLHPDAQPDQKLRAAAERQMKRLNEILATLTDPQKRREYDDTLRIPAPYQPAGARAARGGAFFAGRAEAIVIVPVKQPAWTQAAVRHWFHILIGLAWLVTAIAWYAVPRAQTVGPAPAAPGAEAAAPANVTPSRARRTSRAPVPRPKPTGSSVAAQPGTAPVADPAGHSGMTLPAPGPLPESTSGPAEMPAAGRNAGPAESRFTGSWLYTPQAAEPPIPGRYRAIYIECLLREEAGEIVGTYRARYKVPDQAISPEVALQVRGAPPTGNSGRVVWTARDGARGTLELTLRSPDAIAVVWWTTNAGRRPALSSGEAVLIRQTAP